VAGWKSVVSLPSNKNGTPCSNPPTKKPLQMMPAARTPPYHNHLSGSQLLNLCFDFWESRLLQLLIQRGKIEFEQFVPYVHHRSDFCLQIRDSGLDCGCRRSICALDIVKQSGRRFQNEERWWGARPRMRRPELH